MHISLIQWAVAAMMTWVPPIHSYDEARYNVIAKDVIEVAFDENELPLFKGPVGRTKTVLQILAIASFESTFREDIGSGKVRGKAGDICWMQIVVPEGKRVLLTKEKYQWSRSEGLTSEDLIDSKTCFRVALHMMRESIEICRDLSLYTSGRCNHDPQANNRELRATKYFTKHPFAMSDSVVSLLN